MDFMGKQPIYQQIGDFVYENILLKKWTEGDKIPSIRDFAITIEVNPNTVMRAYSYLQERSIIANQRGIGYFVAEGAYRRTKEMKKKNFIENELPVLFKTLKLLGMTLKDLETYFESYKIQEKERI